MISNGRQEGFFMADKRASAGNRLVSGLVGFAAAFGARKILIFGWKRITGKEPPEHPEDPQVELAEALTWGILMGVGVQIARMLALRAANKLTSGPTDGPQ
jgi:hypothetical protein